MTRKDYELLADAIRVSINLNQFQPPYEERLSAIRSVIYVLADFLLRENPRFDRERFEKACGLED